MRPSLNRTLSAFTASLHRKPAAEGGRPRSASANAGLESTRDASPPESDSEAEEPANPGVNERDSAEFMAQLRADRDAVLEAAGWGDGDNATSGSISESEESESESDTIDEGASDSSEDQYQLKVSYRQNRTTLDEGGAPVQDDYSSSEPDRSL